MINFILTGFYIGKIKYAPGTFGTLLAIPIYLLLFQYDTLLKIIFLLILFSLSLYLLQYSYAKKLFKNIDDGSIVIDEIIGFLCFMIFFDYNFYTIVLGFTLFRIFDILKPYPISLIDTKMKNPLGVLLDDIVAGVFSGVILFIIIHVFSR
jgi:phosphatidylglycerophosphatase A|tara:strand:+ start:55 stop:507 length:453 start_codon:yes stop_codon:yes gene_type:complete